MNDEKIMCLKQSGPIPEHVAIIMDGNGRWAKQRGLKRTEGHREGLEAIRAVSRIAAQIGVKVLTIYAFSTENWGRPASEINYIMSLPKYLTDEFFPEIKENGIRIQRIGSTKRIPKKTLKVLDDAIQETKNNQNMLINVAFNYGGREDIIQATKKISEAVQNGELEFQEIDEALFNHYLSTGFLGELSDPDFMIRTSGELRISNFLLWQSAYTEFYFTDCYWPDFREEEFIQAIKSFQTRQRRYGKV